MQEKQNYKITTLIFDLDGTLIDSKQDIADAVNFALIQLGVPEVTPQVVWGHIGGGIRALLSAILKTKDIAFIKKADCFFRQYYCAHCLDKTVPYPGMISVLEHFSKQQKRMAVVTNKDQEFTDKILAGLGVAKYFHSRIGAGAGDRKKPDPELLHKALEEMNSNPVSAVIIGDSPADIEAGRKAGTKTCGVTYGIGSAETIQKAQPDFWANQPSELIWLF